MSLCVFFFNDTATTEIYTLSLHDALPISAGDGEAGEDEGGALRDERIDPVAPAEMGEDRHRQIGPGREAERVEDHQPGRSEEHTSELQSRQYLVCRLLLEKKKTTNVIECM